MFPIFLKVVDDVVTGALLVQRFATLLQPATLANPLIATIAALASMLSLLILSGVAISSVVILLAAILGLYFLVTEVLGISIEVAVP